MKVTYISHSGDDLLVVNAARVSMNKKSDWVIDVDSEHPVRTLSNKDKKLISYLAKHKHWTPFGHCYATLHVKVPIFVARQLMRSNVGIVYNEVSRRYVDNPPEFWWPDEFKFRARAENVKQGSLENVLIDAKYADTVLEGSTIFLCDLDFIVKELYEELLARNIAPELARVILPQNMYTEFYMSGTLAAFARVCKLRLDPHAQKEIRDVAEQISDIMKNLYPVSWKALMDE